MATVDWELINEQTNATVPITERELVIGTGGRDQNAEPIPVDVQVGHIGTLAGGWKVSRRHARVSVSGARPVLVSLGGNGVRGAARSCCLLGARRGTRRLCWNILGTTKTARRQIT